MLIQRNTMVRITGQYLGSLYHLMAFMPRAFRMVLFMKPLVGFKMAYTM